LGCATLKEIQKKQIAQRHLLRSQELLTQGDYEGSAKENQKVLSLFVKEPPSDKALFNIGIIYAHYGNPERDYNKSREYFEKLIKEYPQSHLIEQAKIWVGVLLEIDKQTTASEHLLRSWKLLVRGDYKGSLKENQKVLSLYAKGPPGDEALFNIGLIYAHYGNPEKDYKKSRVHFARLIKKYPQSPLTEQAKIWLEVLTTIEKAKQVDIEIEKKKKELTR
jgi:TolA-binding protein